MSTITTNTRNVRGVCERTEAPHSDDLHCTRRMSSDGQLPPDQHTGQDKPGITPVFNPSLEAGVMIPCPYSPCSIPIFPLEKAPVEGPFKKVKYAVHPSAPIVPDPHTLLTHVLGNSKWFQ